ncbi:MAG: hypothetical protein NW223_23680 [Hyphomicrobiaceae bacterium]|nr:hypothetical protein [Hyphomicrobiaceae bacterium]
MHRLLITTTDRYGDELGTRRAWLDDLLPDLDGDFADLSPGEVA